MDPATIAMGVTALVDLTQTLQQYSNGTITQDQAHAQFLAAHANLAAAVAQFQNAKPA
jgi:hypothetical protein